VTPEETVKLCQYIQAACPAQRFDEYTPDVWAEIFPSWLTLDDAHAAVIVIKQRLRFVDPSDIIAEVKRIRSDRLARAVIAAPPAELTDSPGVYKAELDRRISVVAAGFDPRPALREKGMPKHAQLRALEGGKP
jgi:hypothetical protein